MKPNWKSVMSLLSFLSLVLLSGCLKAGDGVGVDASGKVVPFCTSHPTDPKCVVDPCISNPSGPTCPDACVLSPTSKACSLLTCQKTPSTPGCAVLDCAKTPTAVGCSVNVCLTNPSLPECTPKTKFSEVQAILEDQCTQCHSPGGQGLVLGKLNLTTDSAYANLVGVLVSNQVVAPGWLRVNASRPDSSMIILKLTGGTSPELPSGKIYGAGMPLGKPVLPEVSINIIKKWITDGALK